MTLRGRLAMERVYKAVEQAAKRAIHRSTVLALRYARGISEGPFSSKELADQDHPYARRHGSIQGSVHPFWINRQTGEFRRDWSVESVNVIKNPTPYASYLWKGTPRMFGRSYPEEVRREWERLRIAEIERELAKIGLPVRGRRRS